MQIDLQLFMQIEKVVFLGQEMKMIKEGNVYFIDLLKDLEVIFVYELDIFFGGKFKVSRRLFWDGGLIWWKDLNDKDIVMIICQGDGVFFWWFCKDYMYDEVDSMLISVKVFEGLMDVFNGRLCRVDEYDDGSKIFYWFVFNLISNYVINFNVFDYV